VATTAEHPETRTNRFRPPACLFRGAGYSASRPAHPRQYTPLTIVARSQSAPHPSHTFKSMRKSFIITLSRRVLPRQASVFFSGRVGLPGCWQMPSLIPQSSNGTIGQAASSVCFSSVSCTALGKITSTLHRLPPWFQIQFQTPSFVNQESRLSLLPFPFWKVSRL
jgi:hypothetical protein